MAYLPRNVLIANGTVSVTTAAQDIVLERGCKEVQIKNLGTVAGRASPKSVLGAASTTVGTRIIGAVGFTELIPVGDGETLSVIGDGAATWECNQYG